MTRGAFTGSPTLSFFSSVAASTASVQGFAHTPAPSVVAQLSGFHAGLLVAAAGAALGAFMASLASESGLKRPRARQRKKLLINHDVNQRRKVGKGQSKHRPYPLVGMGGSVATVLVHGMLLSLLATLFSRERMRTNTAGSSGSRAERFTAGCGQGQRPTICWRPLRNNRTSRYGKKMKRLEKRDDREPIDWANLFHLKKRGTPSSAQAA